MTSGARESGSPVEALLDLVRGLRARLEWQRASFAFGMSGGEVVSEPEEAAPPSVVEEPPAPRPVAPRAPASLASTGPGAVTATAPLQVPTDPAERRRALEVLAETVRGCERCALHAGRKQTVFARGTGSSGVCFVGEGPGADEDAQGFPFVGAAGQLLDRMIAAMGLARDEVYVCNIVKCRPPRNRKPEPAEMEACRPYLAEQLELVAPRVIVALGATAVQGLLGTSEGITRLRGTWKLYRGRIPVMPTFHPAYLLRTPAAKREVWLDLQAVLRHLGLPVPTR